jgi:hypothetical protein
MRHSQLLLSLLTLAACGSPVGSADAGSTNAGGGSANAVGGGTATAGGAAGGASTTAGGSASAGGTASAGGSATAGGAAVSNFSFFVTSYAAIKRLAPSDQGFGGDLRFGETGVGAGLRGADKLCATIAEQSMPGAGAKGWRAFLSADEGEDGGVVNARDRVGQGPWYDRRGRLVAMNLGALLTTRPTGCDTAICNDLPNEDGVPNHAPEGAQLDNHDTLTGSNAQGNRVAGANCRSWTTSATDAGRPPVGHSWPAMSGQSWMNAHPAGGCGAGVNLQQTGGPNAPTVGAGGGYGGLFCFALQP